MRYSSLVSNNLSKRRNDRPRSEEHTSELQSLRHLVCRLLLEKKKHTSELQALRHLVCRLLLGKKKTGDRITGGERHRVVTIGTRQHMLCRWLSRRAHRVCAG